MSFYDCITFKTVLDLSHWVFLCCISEFIELASAALWKMETVTSALWCHNENKYVKAAVDIQVQFNPTVNQILLFNHK